MRKALLIMMALTVSIFTAMPQKVANESNRAPKTSTGVHVREIKTGTKKFQGKLMDSEMRMVVGSMKKTADLPKISEGKAPLKATAHALEGVYAVTATSYFDGKTYKWEVTITQDGGNPDKFWIDEMCGFGVELPVYGILDGTKFTIPAGQIILDYAVTSEFGDDDAVLVGYADGSFYWGGSIPANVSFGTGKITFEDGFGVVGRVGGADPEADAFYELYTNSPKPVFQNKAGGTGEDDPVPPSAYIPTPGTLYYGLSHDGFGLNGFYAVAPPYQGWTFKNITTEVPKLTFSWTYNDGETSTAKDLLYEVEEGYWDMPSLTSIMPTEQSEFTLGLMYGEFDESSIDAGGGGSLDLSGHLFNLTNANIDYDIVGWRFAVDDYVFGTGSSCNCSKLVSFFDGNPEGLTYFEGVDILAQTLTASPSTKFTMEVVKANRTPSGSITLGDVIATSVATMKDFIAIGTSAGTLRFSEFVARDEEGFDTDIPYVEVEGSYALVLSGFNVSGVKLAVMSEYEDRPDDLNYSYLIDKTTGKIKSYSSIKNTMLFSLIEGYYSYLRSSTSKIHFPEEGGSSTIEMVPFFDGVFWDEEDLPEWLTITQNDHFVSGNWGSTITVNAEPSTVDRAADIEFSTWGARATVKITQSGGVTISSPKEKATSALRKGNDFILSYPSTATSVEVYNIAGQKLNEYKLNASGTYTLPASGLMNGVYILKFNGSNSVVKILK